MPEFGVEIRRIPDDAQDSCEFCGRSDGLRFEIERGENAALPGLADIICETCCRVLAEALAEQRYLRAMRDPVEDAKLRGNKQ